MVGQNLLLRVVTRLVAVTIITVLVSCAETQTTYFPLELGRQWHYKVDKSTMDGMVTQKYLLETIPSIEIDGVLVSTKQTFNGHQFFYRVDERGVSRIAYRLNGTREIQTQTPILIVLPQDLRIGTSWQQPTNTSALESSAPPWESLFRIDESVEMKYVIESIDDVITVPAGKFTQCIRVFGAGAKTTSIGSYIGQTTIGIEVTEWYAPNVGLVLSRRTERSDATPLNAGSIVMELESY